MGARVRSLSLPASLGGRKILLHARLRRRGQPPLQLLVQQVLLVEDPRVALDESQSLLLRRVPQRASLHAVREGGSPQDPAARAGRAPGRYPVEDALEGELAPRGLRCWSRGSLSAVADSICPRDRTGRVGPLLRRIERRSQSILPGDAVASGVGVLRIEGYVRQSHWMQRTLSIVMRPPRRRMEDMSERMTAGLLHARRLLFLLGEPGHAQRRVDRLRRPWRACHGRALADDGLAPPQSVPFDDLVLGRRLEQILLLLAEVPLRLLHLHLLSRRGYAPDDRRRAADRVRLGLGLGLLLLPDLADLIEVALEDRGVRHVLGGLGELQQHDAGADLQESHDDRRDLDAGPLEALEQDRRRHDRRAREEDVVGRRDKRCVEYVQSFLLFHQQIDPASAGDWNLRSSR